MYIELQPKAEVPNLYHNALGIGKTGKGITSYLLPWQRDHSVSF